jgi:hypothetical protein
MPWAGFEPAIPFLENTIQTTRTEVYYVINIYTYKYKYIYQNTSEFEFKYIITSGFQNNPKNVDQ